MPYSTRYAFNKAYGQKVHARNRARQRYSLDLSPALAIRIGDVIRNDRAEHLSGNVFRVDLTTLDRGLDGEVIVAYDYKRKQVVTFLPPDWTVEEAAARKAAKPGAPVAIPDLNTPPFHEMTLEEIKASRAKIVARIEVAETTAERAALNKMMVKSKPHLDRLKKADRAKVEAEAAERRAAKLEQRRLEGQRKMSCIMRELYESAGVLIK